MFEVGLFTIFAIETEDIFLEDNLSGDTILTPLIT